MGEKWGIGLGTATPTAMISWCFGPKMVDIASAITQHPAPDSLRSTGLVKALRVSSAPLWPCG